MPNFPQHDDTSHGHESAPSPADALDGVSGTALWTVRMRAQESVRADALFEDPLAAEFLARARKAGSPPGRGVLQQVLPDWLAVRTRFFDDHLLAVTRAGRSQVVLLGAGLDTRAHRLDWPAGVHLFEVDLPAVHAFKERIVAGHPPAVARRVPVAADLLADWRGPLLSAGFDPGRPTAWLCEGLLFYLAPEAVDRLVAVASELSAPGSTLGAECLNADAADSPFVRPWLEALSGSGTPWVWHLADADHWWGERGWQAQVADLLALPYAVERFAPHLAAHPGLEKQSMLLVTATRPAGGR
ncbi:S-adenosyl-L-methionine-dependent methyltransferase [Streptomyces spiralis]|uniref:S-adenosyl-L-methionine-dependent methyltransferase n=1 Tax=Streptomyces spiralis TaxID=66376 RepID=A0A919DL36_9ACTN|nr:SAM-dependent methyltransferase [Streptomyces spiralis]GHE55385.1 S-adenosyl-L-methionine-dependent methyltransferase [Streptomyces spiralis]